MEKEKNRPSPSLGNMYTVLLLTDICCQLLVKLLSTFVSVSMFLPSTSFHEYALNYVHWLPFVYPLE